MVLSLNSLFIFNFKHNNFMDFIANVFLYNEVHVSLIILILITLCTKVLTALF